ncbi:hypothetical protein BJX65DRAFT_271842 [Aspergillus insuetus]
MLPSEPCSSFSFALQFSYLSPISSRIRDSRLVYRGLLRSTPSPASEPATRFSTVFSRPDVAANHFVTWPFSDRLRVDWLPHW